MHDEFNIDYARKLYDLGKWKEHYDYCMKYAGKDAGAQNRLGICSEYGNGIPQNEEAAFDWYLKAAYGGSLEGQLNLAICYLKGVGTPQNLKLYFKWTSKAAEKEYPAALYQLGMCYYYGNGVEKDDQEAFKCFRKAVDLGYVGAQFSLGLCYFIGIGEEKNEDEAVKWFEEAVKQREPRAQCFLGICYLDGISKEKDEKKAVELFTEAAEQGNDLAQCYLGWCYRTGTGAEKNEKTSFEWAKRSAQQGNAQAQCDLGWHYLNGTGTQQNTEKAFEFYIRSCNQGNVRAYFYLGFCYQKGLGTPRNMDAAVDLFQKAAQAGLPDAQYELGLCYEEWKIFDNSLEKAADLYIKAAESGYAEALLKSGECYENGIGVKADPAKALAHYELAMNKEVKKARYYYLRLSKQITDSTAKDAEIRRLKESEREYKEEFGRAKRMTDMVTMMVSSHQNISNQLKVLQSAAEKIEGKVDVIDTKIDKLSDYITGQMNEDIQSLRNEFKDEGKFFEKAVNMLQKKIGQEQPNLLRKAETELKAHFGGEWDKMLSETQTSLKSAHVLWKLCCSNIEDKADFDYSGVVICATSALENELRKWFFDGFQKYLMKKYNRNYSKWPNVLLYKKNVPNNRFTLSTVPMIFGDDKDATSAELAKLGKCRNEYLATKMLGKHRQNEYSDCFTKNYNMYDCGGCGYCGNCGSARQDQGDNAYERGSLVAQIEHIRENFRNAAAHTGKINKLSAEECCARILGKFEAKEKYNEVCEVLLQILKLFKK